MKQVNRGYAFLMLLLGLAVVSLTAASFFKLGQFGQRRTAELELLEKGSRMDSALASYARLSTGGQSSAPKSLEDLLRDPRFPKSVIRHLRQVEVDPMTGGKQWGLVWSEDGKGIVGMHSLSEEKPVMTVFGPEFSSFTDLPRYADWIFGQSP